MLKGTSFQRPLRMQIQFDRCLNMKDPFAASLKNTSAMLPRSICQITQQSKQTMALSTICGQNCCNPATVT